ncbi:MAG: Xaa-Pro aminopeptidase [Flavobacteriales bacterium]|nr:MAG: Xaa-Pro aminopeptidase [Flavobacteriales bacterium]
MKRIAVLSLLVFAITKIFGQTNIDSLKPDIKVVEHISFYDNDLLSNEFHADRRQVLREKMPDSSVALVFAYPVQNRSNDVDFEYHQNPNLYYLTGLIEPHALLLIFKEKQDFDSIKTDEIIFVQPRDSSREIWDGKRLGAEGVKSKLDILHAYENYIFADFLIDFSRFNHIFSDLPSGDFTDDKRNRGDLASLVKHFHIKIDTLQNKLDRHFLREVFADLREIKQPEELVLLRKAIDITCDAQKELMRALLPGMKEYQAEAIIEYIFKNNGAEYPGFPSIVGGGENSCILHYTSNRKTLTWDDMLVVDIGAEYHGYSADVTRTLAVDGEFSEEQKTIYNIVLEAQQAGINVCKKGNKFWQPGDEARRVVSQRLLKLGIISKEKQSRQYFMHGTSHYLGLDVHDVGLYGNLKPGSIITVEPGIYIPKNSPCDPKWWNIGVRIEDDILITEGRPEILSDCVPKTIEEIEALMKEESLFNKMDQKSE